MIARSRTDSSVARRHRSQGIWTLGAATPKAAHVRTYLRLVVTGPCDAQIVCRGIEEDVGSNVADPDCCSGDSLLLSAAALTYSSSVLHPRAFACRPERYKAPVTALPGYNDQHHHECAPVQQHQDLLDELGPLPGHPL